LRFLALFAVCDVSRSDGGPSAAGHQATKQRSILLAANASKPSVAWSPATPKNVFESAMSPSGDKNVAPTMQFKIGLWILYNFLAHLDFGGDHGEAARNEKHVPESL
jgi:hypothetical protein